VASVGASNATIVVDSPGSNPTLRVGDLSAIYSAVDSIIVNVKNHGAVGNAVADDTAAINAAIAKLNPALGGVIYFPPGWYLISAAINIPNYTTIVGAGEFATIIRTTSTTADVFTSTGTVLVGIRNLQIDSVATRTAGSGVNFTTVTNYTIDHVRFVDCYNAGTFTTANTGFVSNILLVHGSGVWNRGFVWKYCIDTHCHRIIINGGTAVLSGSNAWLQVDSGCDTWSMMDSGAGASSGSGLGFYLSHTDGGSFPPRWVKLTNFWFEGSSGSAGSGSNGIQIDNCQDAQFFNGYVSTSLNGVYITGGRDILFASARVQNCWSRGSVVSSAGTLDTVTFRDVKFDSNSQGANGSVGHLLVGGTAIHVRVRDCKFSNQGLGLTNKVTYAIENSVPQSQDLQVSGSTFISGDYVSGIFGGSAPTQHVARDNYGYNPVGSLSTPAVPATTVAYTNLFGVDATVHVAGGTVTAISVAGAPAGTTTGAFRVPAGSTIAITYTVAPSWTWFGD
jgi:hypothetical protein